MKSKAVLFLISSLVIVLLLPGRFASAQPVQPQATIPAGATITSADLVLYVNDPSAAAATVNIHRITIPWIESQVTWNNMHDQFGPTLTSFSPAPNVSAYYTISITELVQAWVDGVYPNYGIALEQGDTPQNGYASSENATTSHRPELTICYTAPGVNNTCFTIQRESAPQDGVADDFACTCASNWNLGGTYPTLYAGTIGTVNPDHRQAQIRFNFTVTNPSVSIVKYTNGAVASNPDSADVPSIKAGDPVTWTYKITNSGNVTFTAQEVSVSDDQPGVVPVFDKIIGGASAATFKPGDIWQYKATGVAANLVAPPPGMKTVSGVCTHGGTQMARPAYVNQGTVSVPGAAPKTAKSSYCNPANPGIGIVKYTNGAIASNPNGIDVPFLKPGDAVIWTYQVTNNGNISVSRSSVSVTDDQPGVLPAFEKEITGNGNTTFDPGEVWQYKATGKAVNLSSPPAGVKVVKGVCTVNGTRPAHTAYVNQGTVSVPNIAPQTAKSNYCNPITDLYLPLTYKH